VTQEKDKPATIAVSAGRMTKQHFGVVNTPVYRASTILHEDVATLLSGKSPYVYGRRGTPTTQSFEDAINALEDAAHTASLPSGLNAIATAILSVCGMGDHLLMVDSCYGPTRHLCETTFKRFGIEASYYDPLLGADVAREFRPNTKAVYCESPGSLTFEMQDIPAIAAAAQARGISVLMDNTWATPVHFQPLRHGVDLSIQAATKYIGGHADVMIGYVSANESHAKRLRDTVGNLGLYASGDDCYLALRGVRTLPVRLKRHEQNAMTLARWLEARPEVLRILYPALESDPGHAIWKRDFTGACGLFGVVLKPVGEEKLLAFIEGMAHFGIGWSWGGFESLIVPAHFKRNVRPLEAEGPVIRIHAGLEDAGDLLADLEAGFERMAARE
jgi:cysteine-S-conjugate beta-lyase